MAADNRSAYKWTQHPVISTVLWALETATIGSTKKEVSPTPSALKWKDEGSGGNTSLNEYISHVQPPKEPSVSRMEEEAPQLRPGASRKRQEFERNMPERAEDVEGGGPADYTPSPQWGFYVPITPPQAEMFSAKPVEQKS
jgi:hypothetical protein